MVKLEIFSVIDTKAELFIQPYFAPTVASGIRMFESAVNDEKLQFKKHAGDYTLFHLGTINQHTGELIPLKAPANLGLAITFLETET